ncbi:MAG: nickel-dependent lactate racemase [Victivallales bacterium]|nr:nickel-dependent lactate racemase [Victivallales bacterium]
MPEITLPYAHTHLRAQVPDENLIGAYSATQTGAADFDKQQALVAEALENPVGSPRLRELAKNKRNMVIITSDHSRPVPTRVIMPLILEEARRGNPGIDITILVATGFHRATTREELIAKLGEEIVADERIIVHCSTDKESLVRLADLPSGGELWVNRLAVETDLLIAEGFIEPHFFAGFSGGRKSVLPGVAGKDTVLANHCAEFIASEYARTGIIENNPVHRDMLFAAEQAKLAFIVNVIIDEHKNIVKAFAGHQEKAHRKGYEFLAGNTRINVPEADIVITSNGGYPLDQNVYQAVKGMTAAETAVRPGGVIIMAAACNDGHGGQSFYDHLAQAASPAALLDKIKNIPRNKTIPDQWEFQILARVLCHCKVIMVSDMCDPEMITNMHMEWAPTLKKALARAFELQGKDAKVAVIPDGVSVIVKKIN